MKTMEFGVTVEMPDGVTSRMMVEYIEDAVATLRGSFSPDDPLFDLDPDSVKVERL